MFSLRVDLYCLVGLCRFCGLGDLVDYFGLIGRFGSLLFLGMIGLLVVCVWCGVGLGLGFRVSFA